MIQANDDYFKVHSWLIYHFGRADMCEGINCTLKNPKRFEWAHITGKPMIKDRHNFIMLCPSCHRKYDFTEQQRLKQSSAAKGRTFSKATLQKLSKAMKGVNNVPILQFTQDGNIIAEHESVSMAAKHTSISQSAISNTLTHRAKTAGGFIWQYKRMN